MRWSCEGTVTAVLFEGDFSSGNLSLQSQHSHCTQCPNTASVYSKQPRLDRVCDIGQVTMLSIAWCGLLACLVHERQRYNDKPRLAAIWKPAAL